MRLDMLDGLGSKRKSKPNKSMHQMMIGASMSSKSISDLVTTPKKSMKGYGNLFGGMVPKQKSKGNTFSEIMPMNKGKGMGNLYSEIMPMKKSKMSKGMVFSYGPKMIGTMGMNIPKQDHSPMMHDMIGKANILGDRVSNKQRRYLKKHSMRSMDGMDRFIDSDRDGVINGLDCDWSNPNKHGLTDRFKNLFQGKGFKSDVQLEAQKEQAKYAEEANRQGEEIRKAEKEYQEKLARQAEENNRAEKEYEKQLNKRDRELERLSDEELKIEGDQHLGYDIAKKEKEVELQQWKVKGTTTLMGVEEKGKKRPVILTMNTSAVNRDYGNDWQGTGNLQGTWKEHGSKKRQIIIPRTVTKPSLEVYEYQKPDEEQISRLKKTNLFIERKENKDELERMKSAKEYRDAQQEKKYSQVMKEPMENLEKLGWHLVDKPDFIAMRKKQSEAFKASLEAKKKSEKNTAFKDLDRFAAKKGYAAFDLAEEVGMNIGKSAKVIGSRLAEFGTEKLIKAGFAKYELDKKQIEEEKKKKQEIAEAMANLGVEGETLTKENVDKAYKDKQNEVHSDKTGKGDEESKKANASREFLQGIVKENEMIKEKRTGKKGKEYTISYNPFYKGGSVYGPAYKAKLSLLAPLSRKLGYAFETKEVREAMLQKEAEDELRASVVSGFRLSKPEKGIGESDVQKVETLTKMGVITAKDKAKALKLGAQYGKLTDQLAIDKKMFEAEQRQKARARAPIEKMQEQMLMLDAMRKAEASKYNILRTQYETERLAKSIERQEAPEQVSESGFMSFMMVKPKREVIEMAPEQEEYVPRYNIEAPEAAYDVNAPRFVYQPNINSMTRTSSRVMPGEQLGLLQESRPSEETRGENMYPWTKPMKGYKRVYVGKGQYAGPGRKPRGKTGMGKEYRGFRKKVKKSKFVPFASTYREKLMEKVRQSN